LKLKKVASVLACSPAALHVAVVCCFVMVDIKNDDDIEQYNPVLDLEQYEWNSADW
jgi:hypothetical protein